MDEVTKSSGNIFQDLELPDPEERLAKAKLARAINNIIEERGLKQKEAAEILGIDQPKVSHLKNGRLSGFSIERLFFFLQALDTDIEIVLRPAEPGRKRRGITITGI